MIDADAVLLDLYDTVAEGAWGDLATFLLDRIGGVTKETLFRAFDETRPARSVGAFATPEGDISAVIAACGVEPDPHVVEEVVALELASLPSRTVLYEDSIPVVRGLREAGIPTALISNCSHSTRPIVDSLGLEDEFDTVVLSFEVGAAKPDPLIYREALSRLGNVVPERTVFVDDQARYCDGAAAVGIRTRLIMRKDANPAEGFGPNPNGHEVIKDLRALL